MSKRVQVARLEKGIDLLRKYTRNFERPAIAKHEGNLYISVVRTYQSTTDDTQKLEELGWRSHCGYWGINLNDSKPN